MRSSDWSSDVCSSDLRDVVVVVDADEATEPQVASEGRRFVGHALREVAVADDAVGAVVDHVGTEASAQLPLRQRQADRVGDALAERTGGDLDAGSVAVLRVPWCARSEEHTSELQSLMRISYAVFCLKKKKEDNDS